MMKRFFVMILLIPVTCAVQSQVTLQPIVPPVGMMQKSQLWNVLIINNSTELYNCRLDIFLTERNTNLEIFTAASGSFNLSSGAKQMNASFLGAIQYNYISGGFDTRLQGVLPVGSYTACYTLTALGVKETTLAEECVPFDVEALSPPMLMNPLDSSNLEITPGQFSWIPPAPGAMFDHLNYQLIITPVNEGQNAEEALQENIPFYSENNLQPNFLNYSGAYNSFDKNKWYAWQVIARDNKSYAVKSEAWVFKISDTKPQPPDDANYISLNNGLAGRSIHTVKGEVLSIKYYCDEGENISSINIYTTGRKLVQKEKKKMIYGNNFFNMKLKSKFLKEQVYIIEIIAASGKKYSTLFNIAN